MPDAIEHLSQNEIKSLLNATDIIRDRAILTLFLNTGIFLNELIDLKIDSIDWKGRALKVPGNRSRTIPLNDQTYESLARWSKDRPDSKSNHFFITTKGEVKDLSARAVDKLIRKYADQAKIKRRVNAQVLRNTFAVRLFKEEISLDKATAILGITDPQSINRYIQAAKQPAPAPTTPKELKHVESQSKMARLASNVFPTKPKIAKPMSDVKGPVIPNPEELIIGREGTIEEINFNLTKNRSVLLIGELGIGKTHILKHLSKKPGQNIIYIQSPSPIKSMLTQICEKINPEWKKEVNSRAATREIIDFIAKNKGTNPPVLIIDNLNKLKISDVDSFLALLENFTILGATEEISPKLKQLWWKFKQIEIKPLSKESAKKLIRYLSQNLSISDYDLLETRVMTLSNRLPLAIVDMVHQVSHHPVVTRDSVREVYHEAGIRYRDWTAAVVILWALAIMFRFIALGTHSFEGYILAGFGMATIMVMRFFAFKGR